MNASAVKQAHRRDTQRVGLPREWVQCQPANKVRLWQKVKLGQTVIRDHHDLTRKREAEVEEAHGVINVVSRERGNVFLLASWSELSRQDSVTCLSGSGYCNASKA